MLLVGEIEGELMIERSCLLMNILPWKAIYFGGQTLQPRKRMD